MLKTLQIKDYALIENLLVTFKNGLNIITGETGAGKSIIIDALSLILGERADSATVRNGANKAIIEGIFATPDNEKINNLFKNSEIENYDELIIRREISLKGKSRTFINDTPVSIATLKIFGNLLVDLHGQHQHQSLLYPENHINLLDEISGNENLLQSFSKEYKQFHSEIVELKKLISSADELREKREFYEFQLKEIDAVSPEENEDEKLKAELSILENSEKLFSTTAEIFQQLYEDENALYNQLVNIGTKLSELKIIDSAFSEKEKDFNSALVLIEDISDFLRNYQDKVDISPERLEEIRKRLGALFSLKKKFGGSIEAVIKNRNKIADELSLVSNLDEEIASRSNGIENHRINLSLISKNISLSRKEVTESISKNIENHLNLLGILDAEFKVKIAQKESDENDIYFVEIDNTKYQIFQNGVDIAEFFISTNIGEETKPLAKVASGGEISRIMLAIKSVLAQKDKLPLLIFDEIDTGVSGRIAQKVGSAMKNLAEHHQIIAITHLPQIAALADNHFKVQKYESNGRVISTISELNQNERVEEIAKLLSGENVSHRALETAKILMDNN